jgi:hypothetical protein
MKPLHQPALDQMLDFLSEGRDLTSDEGKARVHWLAMFGHRVITERVGVFSDDDDVLGAFGSGLEAYAPSITE